MFSRSNSCIGGIKGNFTKSFVHNVNVNCSLTALNVPFQMRNFYVENCVQDHWENE